MIIQGCDDLKKNIVFFNVFVTILFSVLFMISTKVTQYLIDRPQFKLVLYLSIIWIVSMVLNLVKRYLSQKYFLKRDRTHKGSILKKIIRLPYSFLETKEYADDYNEIASHLEREWISAVCVLITAVCNIIGLVFLVVNQLDIISVALLYGILFVFIIVSWLASTRLSVLMYNYWEEYIKNTRKYTYCTRVLTEKDSYKDKKVFGFLPFFKSLFDEEFDEASKKNRALGKKRIKLEIFIDVIFFICIFSSFIMLLFLYENSTITIGLFVSIIGYLVSLLDKIIEAIKSKEIFMIYKLHNGKIMEFMDRTEASDVTESLTGPETEQAVLRVDNLCFQYPKTGKRVLNNINLTFEKGKKYAIVGENGSGKTTLVKLLIGLYKPISGSVAYCKKPIALFQDYNRYPMTLSENIMLNEVEDKDQSTILDAINAVGLEKKVSKMKNGINTELTVLKDDGEDLSGGEWQRVGLARILCCESDAYILDEPTANLDPLEEIKIFNVYNQLLKDKTVIYITHRLGFVKDVDEIIVIKNGEIAEKGKHDTLVSIENGIYKKMYKEQSVWYEE